MARLLPWLFRATQRRQRSSANDMEKRYPEDTSVRFSYLPVIRAAVADAPWRTLKGDRCAAGQRTLRDGFAAQ